jgi:23S rRNA pseudouridine2605 synthase
MPQDDTSLERLNKLLALEKGISRREADELIHEGRVLINNTVATLGARVTAADTISVSGEPLKRGTAYTYLAFHKPVGYVCSRKQQGENDTIYTLLPDEYHTLKPVGRLDKDSSGLLLLTNDGDFAYKMTHPKFYKNKRYNVSLDHDLTPLHHQMINDFGITLEDGPSKLTLERQADSNSKDWIVTMTEGRNRQIRRTFSSLGYTVTKLHRTHFGPYALGDIPSGEYKVINIS